MVAAPRGSGLPARRLAAGFPILVLLAGLLPGIVLDAAPADPRPAGVHPELQAGQATPLAISLTPGAWLAAAVTFCIGALTARALPRRGRRRVEPSADAPKAEAPQAETPGRRTEAGVEDRVRTLQQEIEERKRAEVEAGRARKAAEAASKAKSEFLATMSHEVRTPMNAVLGFATLLMSTRLDEEQMDYVRTIRSSGESLLALLNDILDFSMIESGHLELESLPIDLVQLTEEVVSVLTSKAEQKQLEMAVWCSPRLPRLWKGDAMRVRQVLLHLLGNAVKFTEKGHILVEVGPWAGSSESHGPEIHFRITDTGIGVAHDQQHLLFRKFQQVDSSPTRKFGGAGIGLAISRMVVELMGGRIGVESEPGKGSTFWFTLPSGIPDAAPPPVEPTGPQGELATLRVLVVHRSELTRRILRQQLADWGLGNGSVSTATDALATLRTSAAFGEPFDVVLLDDSLPDRDPVTLVRELRRDVTLRNCGVILLSGCARHTDTTQLISRGFAATLNTPLARQQPLLEALRRALEHKKALLSDPPSGEESAARESARPPAEPSFGLPQTLPDASLPGRRSKLPQTAGVRVLLAEDDRGNLKLARRMLEGLGCLVTEAREGREVVQHLKTAPFDLIFMDCEMPEVDGFEATAEIRRLESEGGLPLQPSAHLPIVALTANAGHGDRARCLNAGMDDYVSKPVAGEDLSKAVRKWATRAESRPSF